MELIKCLPDKFVMKEELIKCACRVKNRHAEEVNQVRELSQRDVLEFMRKNKALEKVVNVLAERIMENENRG